MRVPRQPPPTPGRARPRDLTGRQTELLDLLEDLFLGEGFAHLTLDGIVSELRCSKMTLYTLAPSREQLTLTVLRRFFDDASRRIDDRLQPIDDPEDRVRVCLAGTADEMRRITPACFDDIAQLTSARELYETFSSACVDRVSAVLVEAARPGRVDTRHIGFLAEVVRLVLEDMCSGELHDRAGLDADEAIEHLVAFVRASAPRPTERPPARMRRIK